jgi:hypothetical protein
VDVARDPPCRLRLLPGIGPRRAAAIDAHRRAFAIDDLDDLDAVPGIGPRTVERLRTTPRVRVVAGGEGPLRTHGGERHRAP